jgi:hypothetical protein
MKSTIQKFGTRIIQMAVLALFATGVTASVAAAQGPFTAHIDWAAQNTDAGGSVDCPDQYFSNGVGYAVAVGGRAAAINQALFDAYHQNFDHAFTLVLMTQCHNPGAQQVLRNAGEKAVLTYLVSNYQATGIDPNQIIGLAQTALAALAGM